MSFVHVMSHVTYPIWRSDHGVARFVSANAYFHDSEIAGQVDFFYGYGIAWVQSSLATLRSCGGGITAWEGTNTSFANNYGV